MTNNDFWMSVSDIINEGFTSEGLRRIDGYAEQFKAGEILYKRFSPSEQHGCIEGGAAHVVASILAGAKISPNQLSAPKGSFKREQQLGKVQEERIEKWAKAVGCWVEDTSIYNKTLGEQIAQGGEAVIYDNGNTVLKTIGLDYFIQPILALDRISLHNAYFEPTKMTVLGFGRNSTGDFMVIVTQTFFQGQRMTDAEIQNYAENLGFKLVNPRNWTYSTPDVYLSDMHDENVIHDEDNVVYVIDCDIRINTPELKAGGTRELTTEVEILTGLIRS